MKIQTSTLSPNLDNHSQYQAYKEILLTRGYKAIVDPQDYKYVSSFNWFAAVGIQIRAARMYRRRMIYMHHEVLGVMPWELDKNEIDHIDGNTLNNTKRNLRIVSHTENMRNTARHKNRIGVCFNYRVNRWIAYLDNPGVKRKYLGYYKTKEEALAIVAEERNG